jgi:thiol:disulfide interchange protein
VNLLTILPLTFVMIAGPLPFLALTLLFLALPVLIVLAFGKRGQDFLPKARDWMNTHSWVVSEIVLVFFVAITINSLVG